MLSQDEETIEDDDNDAKVPSPPSPLLCKTCFPTCYYTDVTVDGDARKHLISF